ncbi:MAG: hypothetical protein RBR54_05465 [Sulfurimonas sp.]|nr:hypothetical protein [Sulfurimonas sp.]
MKTLSLVNSTQINLRKLLELKSIERMLETNSCENSHVVSNKFKNEGFLEIIEQHPFIFFVKKNTFTANTVNSDLSSYASKIHHAINLDLLTFIFKNFSNNELESVHVNCVLIETNNDFKKTEILNLVCYMEKFLERNKESQINKSGKLSYSKLENMFFSIFSKNEYKKLMKKPEKYFFQSIFALNIHRNKSVL